MHLGHLLGNARQGQARRHGCRGVRSLPSLAGGRAADAGVGPAVVPLLNLLVPAPAHGTGGAQPGGGCLLRRPRRRAAREWHHALGHDLPLGLAPMLGRRVQRLAEPAGGRRLRALRACLLPGVRRPGEVLDHLQRALVLHGAWVCQRRDGPWPQRGPGAGAILGRTPHHPGARPCGEALPVRLPGKAGRPHWHHAQHGLARATHGVGGRPRGCAARPRLAAGLVCRPDLEGRLPRVHAAALRRQAAGLHGGGEGPGARHLGLLWPEPLLHGLCAGPRGPCRNAFHVGQRAVGRLLRRPGGGARGRPALGQDGHGLGRGPLGPQIHVRVHSA
mmetsp:Transcript_100290/g.279358  ORF Transcript_100290/g.279358 Transcript_100290/m.279358 type:complete len:332 (+) Transcript_100290:188-1183(+)